MRRIHRVFFLGVVPLLFASFANAAPSGTHPPRLVTVVTESGDTLRALGVQPAGIGSVRITHADGRYEYRSVSHIRRVVDDTGRNRTADALDRGRVVGSIIPGVEAERIPGEPRPVRYGPRSVTKFFTITEASGLARMDRARTDERAFNFSFDLGQAMNVSDRDAVGATLFFGIGDGAGDFGVRARYRRWFNAQTSLDLSPGLILLHEEPGPATGKGIGLVGQVAFTADRWFGFVAQVYSVDRSDVREYYAFGPFTPSASHVIPGFRETGVMFGIRLGGKAGIAAGAAGTLVSFVAEANRHTAIY
ncbi:MAG TPA: hypothetical protein VE326_08165 [Candidatus Binatia bacterium]|nr:hypothetical protein [Candidatus Binatia bacterium]